MILRRLLPTLLLLSPSAVEAQAREPGTPPTLTTERYNEDWSLLDDSARRTGRWTEDFKYVPLDPSGADYLTTGVELRLRNEDAHGSGWGAAAAQDDGYLWLRAMPYADLHVGRVRAFVQPIVAYAVGVRPAAGPVDRTGVDLLQAFADVDVAIGNADVRLRAGRELVGLGSERLVGTRYGPNVPLAFDGGRAIVHRGRGTFNLFYLRPVESRTGNFDDRTSDTRRLWGAYTTHGLASDGTIGLDVYYLGYTNKHAVFDRGSGAEHRHSLGARFFGAHAGWRWNVEAVAQVGRFAGRPIRAWTIAAEFGRAFPKLPLRPVFTLRANAASGDRRGGRFGTFNALFPKGKYFGELSPVGPYNLVNLNPGLSLDLGHGVSAGLVGMAYWRQSRDDGVYDVPGHLIRSSGSSRSLSVGEEVEATLEWRATPELTVGASLSAFRPGTFIRQTGTARNIRLLGLESTFLF